ncbi:MAG: hypothetical protein AB7P02_01345 [Alphaproteobacteria bacterium]
MQLTSQQAFQLSVAFRDAAIAIGDMKIANFDKLSETQRDELGKAELAALNASTEMITRAVDLVLDETKVALGQLVGVTRKAKAAVGTLNDIRKGIRIATAVVGLAAAVVSRDLGAIGKGAKAVADEIDIKLGDLPVKIPGLG